MPRGPRRRATAKLVVVANRLPVDRVTLPDGTVTWRSSPGGVVSALEPVMREQRAAWIGWPGVSGEVEIPDDASDLWLVPVAISESEHEEYYEGFSNGTLWPLYHFFF